jgi:hypothetical protein
MPWWAMRATAHPGPSSSYARRWVLTASLSIPFPFRSSYPERQHPRCSTPQPFPRRFSVFWRKTRDLEILPVAIEAIAEFDRLEYISLT